MKCGVTFPAPKNVKEISKTAIAEVGFKAIKSGNVRPNNTKTPIDRARKISLEVPAQIMTVAEVKVPIM